MQISNTNSNSPTFGARHLSRTEFPIRSAITGQRAHEKIDIYALSKEDIPFLRKLKKAINSSLPLPVDNNAVKSGANDKKALNDVIERAAKIDLSKQRTDSLGIDPVNERSILIAIKDNKTISGFAEYEPGNFSNKIKTLFDFEGTNTRKALSVQLMANSKNQRDYARALEADMPKPGSFMKDFLDSLGFSLQQHWYTGAYEYKIPGSKIQTEFRAQKIDLKRQDIIYSQKKAVNKVYDLEEVLSLNK